jgi:hypothetical protein
MLCRATVGQQLSAQRQTGSPKAICEKAEVPDADEASGQDVQKETTQELSRAESHLTLLATAGVILPAEGDAFLFEGQQAMIGNGHAMGVTTDPEPFQTVVPNAGANGKSYREMITTLPLLATACSNRCVAPVWTFFDVTGALGAEMLVYAVIAVLVAVAFVLLRFYARPMIPRGSKQHVTQKELRRIDIEYGQKK